MKKKKIFLLGKGFTLVEMLVVIGLIALLSTIVLVSVNPARQFKSARDSARSAHLSAILNSIGQDMAENRGLFSCGNSIKTLPSTTTIISSLPGDFELASCLVPIYLASMPYDPGGISDYYFKSVTDYHTGYSIFQDINGHITISAQSETDPTKTISATR